jgi:hypothetical protein
MGNAPAKGPQHKNKGQKKYVHWDQAGKYILFFSWHNHINYAFMRGDIVVYGVFSSMVLTAHSGPWPLIQFRNHFS